MAVAIIGALMSTASPVASCSARGEALRSAPRRARDRPGIISAQGIAKRPRRVAVVGADSLSRAIDAHYLRILQSQKLDIAGVHAPDAGHRHRNGQVSTGALRTPITGRDRKRPGRNSSSRLAITTAMPAEFRFLVDNRNPFLMEKPMGHRREHGQSAPDLAESKKRGRRSRCRFATAGLPRRPLRCATRASSGRCRNGIMRFNQPASSANRDLGSPGCCRKMKRAAAP